MQNLLTLLLLLSCSSSVVLGLRVQIFKDVRFAGLIYEEESDGTGCHTVEKYARGDAGSVKTDTCLMIYERTGCTGNSYKLSRDMTTELENLGRPIFSFHVCNDTYGGDKIQVDMFNGNELIAEYFDICGCQDLPSQVSTQLTRLDNHGNCITVFSSDTCSGSSREIPAGVNGVAQDLPQLGYYVRSVSACGTRRRCIRLSASIFKFVIMDPAEDAPEPVPQEVELGTNTVFYNNGSATISQEYEARKLIREATTNTHSSSIKQMESKTIEKTKVIEKKTTVNLRFVKITKTVTETFKDTYTYEDTEENESSESFTKEVEKEFVVRQTFEVPPCSQYEVSSVVSKMEEFPLRYEVYAKVTGVSSGVRLTANEVGQQVDGMTFVENLDEYTAIFKTTQTIMVSMGVDTVITAQGSPIEGCNATRSMEHHEL